MAICNLSDLNSLMKPQTCLLGLDPGSVVIGVAIADPAARVASPLTGILRTKFTKDVEVLAKIIAERQVGGIIIGLPKNMDGSEGPAAQSVRTFASNLLKRAALPVADIPIVLWDERFSTAAVTRFMLEDDMTRKKRLTKVDQAAAAYILQGALDALQEIRRKDT